jgi:hypothetical protein
VEASTSGTQIREFARRLARGRAISKIVIAVFLEHPAL